MKKLLIIVCLFLGACSKDAKDEITTRTQIVTQNCSVAQVGTDAVVTCPDGTTVTIPQEVVTETIEVIVEVPRSCGHQNNEDPNPEHGND